MITRWGLWLQEDGSVCYNKTVICHLSSLGMYDCNSIFTLLVELI